ncbi:hypothetical protein CTA2_8666 [Colletotrichum tanaceti]|uniref:Uncharacterized protein n=1 Tax=Colletotrichum tanaceti TaxID=1306861 RepID=A0A4U6XJD3_9PEZI|nr:hypothetical protein CTA2_8701 [Colletotrichum tanaceti]KAJ0168917.1 hypothetical protein CTA2_8666 [Colletotrichum tanaceti]TKW55653.1 hypothetical protein CTA1_12614 [Colletotrichum tanaceti]
MAPFNAPQPPKGGGLDLAKPFSQTDHRALVREVNRLIRKKREMESQMTIAMEHLGQSSNAQSQQDRLLQISVRTKTKEDKFIRRQSKVLADREKLLELDPSDARAHDVEVLRAMLSKLRDGVATPKTGHKQKSDLGGDNAVSSVDWDSEMGDSGDDSIDHHNTLDNDLGANPILPIAVDSPKTEKRKRVHEAPQSSKKAKNGQSSEDTSRDSLGVSLTADSQLPEDVDSGDAKKTKKKHKKTKAAFSLEVESLKGRGNQKADASLKDNEIRKSSDRIEAKNDEVKSKKSNKKSQKFKSNVTTENEEMGDSLETDVYHGGSQYLNFEHVNANDKTSGPVGRTVIKNDKEKKRPRTSEPVLVVEVERDDEGDCSKNPTGEILEMEKRESEPIDEVKKKKTKKRNKKTKKNAKTATSAFDDSIINEANERDDLKESKAGHSEGKNSEVDELKKAKKNKPSADNIVANTGQESAMLMKSVRVMDVEQSPVNEGKKKRGQKSKPLATDTNGQASNSEQNKVSHSVMSNFEDTSKPTLMGPTRIATPITSAAPFLETAGRTLLNPWSHYGPTFSIQNPEPTRTSAEINQMPEQASDGQVWVLNASGSRKKKNRTDSETKSVTMTIGKVDAPNKVDQGSPTPPPKKERKIRGRPKKVKEPLLPLESRPATPQGQMSAPGVRASEELVRLITPSTALLGNGERSASLKKLLAKDKKLLAVEADSWFEAMGLERRG